MNDVPEFDEQDIARRYTGGDSIRTIAAAFGISHGAFRNRLQILNGKPRNRGSHPRGPKAWSRS